MRRGGGGGGCHALALLLRGLSSIENSHLSALPQAVRVFGYRGAALLLLGVVGARTLRPAKCACVVV
jgi:hypothetical protein